MNNVAEERTAVAGKDAGINRLTFDIVFDSAEAYELALASNRFHSAQLAALLGVDPQRIVGSYFVDTCHAIKVSVDRTPISGAADDRDIFGAQQQARLEAMTIPTRKPTTPQNTVAITPQRITSSS